MGRAKRISSAFSLSIQTEMEELFLKAGLPADKAKQTLKNEELSKVLASSLESISKNQELTRENGMQVYSLVTKSKKKEMIPDILPFIANGSLDTPAKLDAAISYGQKVSFDKAEFAAECGVGVKITGEDIENAVSNALKAHKDELTKQRYRFNV